MSEVKKDAGQSLSNWYIDFNWFEQNNRSLPVLLRGCLCPRCYQKLKPDSQTVTQERLLKTIKDCCAKTPDFIHIRMPALESVFRLILANGNRPMALGDIMQQLGDRCGTGLYRIPETTLFTLLNNDQYYGLSQTPDKKAG